MSTKTNTIQKHIQTWVRTFFFAITLVMMASSTALAGKKYTGKVVKLSDGDTLQFLANGEPSPFKVRMMAIDTAETHLTIPGGGTASQGYWGQMGARQLAQFISVGDVGVLEVFGEDKYGRKLGRIFKNGEDINLKMVRTGWASLYVLCESGKACKTGGLTQQDLVNYRRACVEAFRNNRGLFNPARPVPELPFVFRARISGQPLSKYVVDLQRGTYVRPEKYGRVHTCDRLFFFDEADARRSGFVPTL